MKGAAFAGCLAAAEEEGVSFVGYGGTSACSIAAVLACVGYTPAELRQIFVNEMSFLTLLDGTAEDLRVLRELPDKLGAMEQKPFRGGVQYGGRGRPRCRPNGCFLATAVGDDHTR